MPSSCDVAVVGAGVAGLTALGMLEQAGADVQCFEARDRAGGRILTLHDPAAAVPVELGAEFVHGRPPEICDLAAQASLAVAERSRRAVYLEEGRIRDSRIGDEVQQLLSDLQAREQPDNDESFADFLARSPYSDEVKRWASAYVEGFNAARKEIISAAALAQDARAAEQIDGERLFSFVNGYDSLINLLSQPIRKGTLWLGAIVEAVEWEPAKVTLHIRAGASGQRETLRCRRVIFTIPLGVLQAKPGAIGAVQFNPPPGRILEAAASLESGHVWRVTLRFESPFWEKKQEFSAAKFFYSQDAVFPTWWNAGPPGVPIITGWSAGPAADGIAGLTATEIPARATASLEHILRIRASPLRAAYFHDWQSDPFSRGAYSYSPVGALAARDILAQPVCDTLYFAGEATENAGHSATVHGAIASGRRAARQILSARPA